MISETSVNVQECSTYLLVVLAAGDFVSTFRFWSLLSICWTWVGLKKMDLLEYILLSRITVRDLFGVIVPNLASVLSEVEDPSVNQLS